VCKGREAPRCRTKTLPQLEAQPTRRPRRCMRQDVVRA
jgi:hypothetical protein